MVFEAPGDDAASAAKIWFSQQGMTPRSREVGLDDPLLSELRKRDPDVTLPIYLVGQSAFTHFTPELATRIVDQEARRAMGETSAPEQGELILSPASAVGAMAFALLGIVMVAFELGSVGRVVLGSVTVVLFVASFWITNAPVAIAARALLVLVGAGAIVLARARGVDWLG